MDIWDRLESLGKKALRRSIASLFDENPNRAEQYSAIFDDMLFDYSKTGMDDEACKALLALAGEADVCGKRDAMFRGDPINTTEGRAVLHTALRNPDGPPLIVEGEDIRPEIRNTLDAMSCFAAEVRAGKRRSSAGKQFTDVVNIGIGGSHLGPEMACGALSPYAGELSVHFISNVDGAAASDVLSKLDPAETLVIVASKTFTTAETMLNAALAKRWLCRELGEEGGSRHLAAVSSALDKTREFGVPDDAVFGFGDWVGGRYSVWGPVGLSLMLAIGPEAFSDFLEGGRDMDEHFQLASLGENLPVLLALVGIWHNQICGYGTRAVLPYDQRLSRLPAYLQQLEMESNGKSIALDGCRLPRHSGPVVWGEPGTNGQHAFHQLLHQGTRIVPCEFLVAAAGHEPELAEHQDMLLANCLAQSRALMVGRNHQAARQAAAQDGCKGMKLETVARHREFEGDRPSTTLVYSKLTPRALGRVVALYEHRVFVEGAILGINSFDQWGVELGKELADSLSPWIAGADVAPNVDASTRLLLGHVNDLRRKERIQ